MKVTNNPSPNPYQSEALVDGVKNSQKTGGQKGVDSTSFKSTGVESHGAEVEISDNAKLMRQASDIAKAAGEIRKDKISALKKSIQDGSYHVDAKEIADRLVDEHLSADFGKNNL